MVSDHAIRGTGACTERTEFRAMPASLSILRVFDASEKYLIAISYFFLKNYLLEKENDFL